MKAPRLLLVYAFAGLAAFSFTGCSTVTVKKPAGDKVANLDPKIWEGTWRGSENFRGVSTIKDPAKGLVEFRSLDPKKKKDSITLTIRELKDRLVATAAGKPADEGAAFFRIVATEGYIAVFGPRLDLFKEAVTSGKVAGELRKSNNKLSVGGKPVNQESVILNQFGTTELAKMPLHSAGNVAECFETDPDMVLVREKKPEKKK